MDDFTPKDIIRSALAQLFDSVGYDPEIMLFRLQVTIAIIGSPPFSFGFF